MIKHNKGRLYQVHIHHQCKWRELKEIPLKQGCPHYPHLFNMVLEMLAGAVRQQKEIKERQIGEEKLKVTFFGK